MTPELIAAITQRIALGRTKDEIKSEILSTGYTETVFEEAYQSAVSTKEVVPSTSFKPSTNVYARATTGTLISFQALFSATWKLAWQEKMVFLKLTAVNLLIGIVAVLLAVAFGALGIDYLDLSDNLVITAIVLAVIFGLAIITCSQMILMRALLKRQAKESLTSHIQWTLKHVVGLSVVSFLTIAIILSGFVFFIVPGVMLTVYLFLSVFFYLDGKAGAVDSLVMTTAHIYGRFWGMVGRILLLGMVVSVITQVAMMLSLFTLFLAPVVMGVVVLFAYYVQYCGYVVLYESIVSAGVIKPLPFQESTLRTTYLVIGVIGLIGICVLLGLLVFSWFTLPGRWPG